MSVAIRKLISSLEAKIVAENDPKTRTRFAAELAAAKTVAKTIEKHETHTKTVDEPEPEPDGDEPDGDEPGGDEEDEKACKACGASMPKGAKFCSACGASAEEDEEKAESGDETDRKADPDDGDGDNDKDGDEDDDEDEAKALAALAATVPGRKGARLAGRLKALVDKARTADMQAERIAKIEQERKGEKREALITGALKAQGGPRITPADAKWLRGQKLATVQSYLAQRTKPIVRTDERVPENDGRPSGNGLSAEAMKEIDRAVLCGANREKLIEANLARVNAASTKGTY